MRTSTILLAPGGATLPDGSAGNAAPTRQRTKSSAAAPSLHFYELLFDPDTDEMCYWVFRCPVTYLSTLVVKIQWKANAVVGDVVWAARVAAITPADVDTPNEKALAAASTVTTTVNAVEARRLIESSITLANLDGLAANDFLVLYVARDADNVADTCLVDAEMVAVTLEFTDTDSSPVIFPHSTYPATAGKVFPNFHVGAGANSKHDEGLGVMASVDADATWCLRFQMPPTLPTGTGKLRLLALAAAVANSAKVNPKWASVAPEEDPSSAALNAEGTQTLTWAAGDSDCYKELKVTLDADTLVASEEVVMDLVFETAAWTLAAVSTWIASIIWE